MVQDIRIGSLTQPMYRSSSVCSCNGKFISNVGNPGGYCGPMSLGLTAPANCVTVFVSPPYSGLLLRDKDITLTAHSSMSAHEPNLQYVPSSLAGCMCLDHWGSVQSSDFTATPTVHVLQTSETCSSALATFLPHCRAQSFEENMIDCDCQVWPEDNYWEPFQLNNPCLGAPILTSVNATCTYL